MTQQRSVLIQRKYKCEGGSITVLSIGSCLVILCFTMMFAVIGQIALQVRAVANSADLVALAAASGLQGNEVDVCARAELVAKVNETSLSVCEVAETSVIVEVERNFRNQWLAKTFGVTRVRAKAGF